MLKHKNCPLCGSDKISVLHMCRDFLVSGDIFPVCNCGSCSFVFTNNAPGEQESAAFYVSDEYISHSDTGKGLINKAYHLVRKWMLASKFRMLREESRLSSASVLDIGSGTGYFPVFLRQKGWECQGIEISDAAREAALARNNISLLPPAAILDIKSSGIDIITMWHALEHFYRPGDYLDASHRILKDDGLLVVAVPNHLSHDAKKYGGRWAAWDVPRHLWHFNPDSMQEMAEKHHFKLQSIRRLPFDAFYVSVLSEKNNNTPFPLIRGFIAGSVSWLGSIRNIRTSSSLVYFFRKDQ